MSERQGYTKIKNVCKRRRDKMIHTTTNQMSKGRGYANSEMHQQTMRQFVRGPAAGRRIKATERPNRSSNKNYRPGCIDRRCSKTYKVWVEQRQWWLKINRAKCLRIENMPRSKILEVDADALTNDEQVGEVRCSWKCTLQTKRTKKRQMFERREYTKSEVDADASTNDGRLCEKRYDWKRTLLTERQR